MYRTWVYKSNVEAYDDRYDQRRRHTNGEQFEGSMERMLRSRATKTLPKFVRGTLPKQYRDSVAMSASKQHKYMGWDLWLMNFANNRERHALAFWYPLKSTSVPPKKASKELIVIGSESEVHGACKICIQPEHGID